MDEVRFSNIRFAEKSDYRNFANLVLDEPPVIRKHLGLLGFDEDYFECSDWKAVFVAEYEQPSGDVILVGCVTVSGGNSCGFNYLGLLYVHESYRDLGFGSKLLKYACDYAQKTWNACGIYLYTIENSGMDRLVKKHGFVNDGIEKKHYYLNGKFIGQKRWIKIYEHIPKT